MAKLKPDIYKKSIFDINYLKLKKEKIKCLVFDLDNTLGLIDEEKCSRQVKKLLNKLKKDFIIYICSNNTAKRIKTYVEDLDVEGVSLSFKPFPKGLIKIRKKTKLGKNEIAMIGDQLVTDILSGKIYGVKTILVDPLGEKDLKITGLNRKIEKIIVRKYEKQGIFARGNYYE